MHAHMPTHTHSFTPIHTQTHDSHIHIYAHTHIIAMHSNFTKKTRPCNLTIACTGPTCQLSLPTAPLTHASSSRQRPCNGCHSMNAAPASTHLAPMDVASTEWTLSAKLPKFNKTSSVGCGSHTEIWRKAFFSFLFLNCLQQAYKQMNRFNVRSIPPAMLLQQSGSFQPNYPNLTKQVQCAEAVIQRSQGRTSVFFFFFFF